MNQKHFEGIFGSVCGVFGGGMITLNIHWSSETNTFVLAMITALLAGGLGWVGQQLFKWGWNKHLKHLFHKNKKHKYVKHDTHTSDDAD